MEDKEKLTTQINEEASKEDKSYKKKKKKDILIGKLQLEKKYIPYICLVALGVFLITIGLRDIIADRREAAQAREEYDHLREEFAHIVTQTPTPTPPPTMDNDEIPDDDVIISDADIDNSILSLDELAALNNDFIGWFSIPDLVEYPVVQTTNNSKYVNTTFMGQTNSAGALFMDYRNVDKWDETVSIIYGHRTNDGTMFAPLIRYMESTFMQRNSTLTILTREGKRLTYEIFGAKLTDAWDPAYKTALQDSSRAHEVFPNAPENANHFLLLSTCTRSANHDERLLVYAALVE